MLVPAFYESFILSLALGVCIYAVSGHSSYCPKERSLLKFHFCPFATAATRSDPQFKLVYKVNVKALTPLPPNVIMTLIFPKIVWKRPLNSNLYFNRNRMNVLQLTSLVCETSVKKLPDVTCLWDAQAVSVGDKLYVGGGTTGNDTSTDEARLYTYIPKKESWHVVETPAYWFALTTYHSKLVLVGGVEVENNSTTDKLWTLHEQFLDSCIPSMGSKRFNASAISHSDHLVVAGGEDLEDDLLLNIVEVYDGYQWTEVQSLPSQCSSMKSTLYKRCWCLMGGYGQGEHVYFCSLDKIVDSCKSSDIYVEDLWGKLPDVPFCNSSPAVLGSRIIAIGGRQSTCYGHAVYAYSQKSESWLLVGELPYEIYNTCTSVLPTGELMVIGGQPTENTNIVFKIVLEGMLSMVCMIA